MSERPAPRLTLVPTPIGNMEDVTLRALRTLREADLVAAEDTRHTATLLARHGIDAKPKRLDAHTVASRGPALLARYERVAYVSDAGTPGVSDPGAELVRLALDAGHEVEVLPGPTAFLPALILSGLPVARFAFEGFLPRGGAERTRRLRTVARADRPTALYVAPHHLVATLKDLVQACGPERSASLSRELSKRFETTLRGTLGELLVQATERPARGEIVLVVGPDPHASEETPGLTSDLDAAAAALKRAGLEGRTLRDALQDLGVPRNDAYRLALDDPPS